MAAGPLTQVTDIVVPAVFANYILVESTRKSRILRSGAAARDALLDQNLAGGGILFNMPAFNDLDDDASRVSTDAVADIVAISESAGSPALPGAFNDAIPFKITTLTEIAVRLSRNGSWASAALAAALAGTDPLAAIASRVSTWWAWQYQKMLIATWQGVSKDNADNDSGDYAVDVAGSAFTPGVTNFTAEASIDTEATMSDNDDQLGILMVHPVVRATMAKNNLIDAIPDARAEVGFETFMGMMLVVDKGMPSGTSVVRKAGGAGVAGMYESWYFGPGATRLGLSSPLVPFEVDRAPASGNGGGSETLFSRIETSMHPIGHAYVGTPADGGPSDATTANNLNHTDSWNRVYPEREQVPFARLVTRESA